MSDRTFLEEITIRSIGVIDQSSLELSKGLTVLSGETGAGKTMILTALNLILGGKADSALVRKGSERLVASGKFSIPKAHEYLFENFMTFCLLTWPFHEHEPKTQLAWQKLMA